MSCHLRLDLPSGLFLSYYLITFICALTGYESRFLESWNHGFDIQIIIIVKIIYLSFILIFIITSITLVLREPTFRRNIQAGKLIFDAENGAHISLRIVYLSKLYCVTAQKTVRFKVTVARELKTKMLPVRLSVLPAVLQLVQFSRTQTEVTTLSCR